MEEVEGFRNQLKEIEASMVDGKFPGDDGSTEEGQKIVKELLDRCLKWSALVLER